MRVLIFDTETTGLPQPDATIFQHDKWPYIIQLSYISYNTENNTFEYYNHYINIDDSITITPASYNIHKYNKRIFK